MPVVTASTSKPTTVRADALVLGVRTDEDAVEVADALAAVGFTGKEGQVATFPAGGLGKVRTVVAVGLPVEPSAEKLRRAAAVGLRAAEKAGARTVAVALHPAGVDEVAAVAEGVGLGAYRFETYKSPDPDDTSTRVESVQVLTPFARQSTTTAAVERAVVVARAVNAARDWVNTAPGDLRPPGFADAIAALGTKGVDVSVWDEKRLAKEGCGGLIGVGAGSDVPPRLVRMTYTPSEPVTHLALVGKGITFDSGGLSIKSGAGMQTMKMDMAGAAAVVAAFTAIAELELPIAVTAWACLAENMPSGSATRPGDVLTLRGGKTVEVHNTDAEGRLVLGDGLALAAESDADHVVDVATLTGACLVALGERTAGVLGNDDAFRDQVLASAERAGEAAWPLPIPEEIGTSVTSTTIADLRQHNPKPYGGTLYAAAFLREFVGEKSWAHLDIAGPAWNDGAVRDYTTPGGTGAAVRTLVRLAEDLSAS
ncbi:leucyl aminopeptidase [Aeromicrobium sp. CF4.19]|uniref:leucyl aminopeptidase n=1 Tax=Aeromicrobium sp. CF4.19 TaxID=3373082 RepID=UPI003EE4F56C